jgi:hypothetical protein
MMEGVHRGWADAAGIGSAGEGHCKKDLFGSGTQSQEFTCPAYHDNSGKAPIDQGLQKGQGRSS